MDYPALLRDETAAFGELIRDADQEAPVPTCPGWTVKQLFRHVGRGNRWSAQIIGDRMTEALSPRDVRDGKPPDDMAAAIDWLRAGARLVVDAVDDVGADTEVWTFLGPRPSAWWTRRRAHEVLVHRVDAALAVGADVDLAPETAADSITEWLEIMAFGPQRGAGLLDPGQSLGLAATDTGDHWRLEGRDDRLVLGREPGEATVSGTAADLLLSLTRRAATVAPDGDDTAWRTWLARTEF